MTEKLKLSDALLSFIDQWRDKKGNLIMILHKVQEEFGFIPRDIAKDIAGRINTPLAKIYGVATFYHFFKLEKAGKYTIQVCMGTACYLKGAEDILNEFSKLLGVKAGQTTDNGLFTIEAIRCLGCCSIAPVVKIGEKIFGNVTKDQIPEIITNFTQNEGKNNEE